MARSLLYRCRILQVSDVHNLFLTGVRCSYCASVGCSFLAAVNCQYLPSFAEIVQPFLCTQTVCFPPNVQFLSSGNRTFKNKETEDSLDSEFPRLTHRINIASVQMGKESFPQQRNKLNNSALEKMPVFTTNLLLPRGRESSCI